MQVEYGSGQQQWPAKWLNEPADDDNGTLENEHLERREAGLFAIVYVQEKLGEYQFYKRSMVNQLSSCLCVFVFIGANGIVSVRC